MEIKLKRATYENFKGIKGLVLDFNGRNASLYGENATFKTSTADGFHYCLFGKDSSGKSDFSLKTLDAEGNVIHGLDHSVEVVLGVDGKDLTLKRTYRELWQKRRGSADREFSGHSSDFWIDGVPCKKQEYEAKIASLIDEDIFKLLTDPRRFNNLHWTERRKILLDVCGDISQDDVISSNGALKGLPEILGDHKLDDYKKIIKAKQAEINKRLPLIETRIDEANRALPDLAGLSKPAFENELHILTTLKAGKEQQKLRIESGGEIAEKKKRLAEVEGELLELKNRLRMENDEKAQAERKSLANLNVEIEKLDDHVISPKSRCIESNNWEIERLDAERESLRKKWTDVNALEFEQGSVDDVCPTCNQSLPADQVQAAREKALAIFNRAKAEDLEKINQRGQQTKAEVDRLVQHNEQLRSEILAAEGQMVELTAKRDEIQIRIADIWEQAQSGEDYAYIQKLEGKQILLDAIAALQQDTGPALEAAADELAEIETKITAAKEHLQKFTDHARGQERIKELSAQERELAGEYERLEKALNLCDEFTRAKVKMLDEKINSRFKLARFKMFDVQVNGGIEECCETMHGGVPWSTGLNNGAQINVGIDIINTLAEHYGFTAPIIVDNAESVTEIIPTPAQLVRLVVSEPDKKLRIEYEEDK